MANKYRKIRDSERGDIWMLDGNVGDAINYLEGIRDEHGSEATLDFWVDDHDRCTVMDIRFERDETDRERNKRLKDASKARDKAKVDKAKQEENERAELARLQKKYS